MVWQTSKKFWGKPERLPTQSGSPGFVSWERGVVVMLELCAYETPDGSVGKILVSSILPDIHRCL